VSALFDLWYTRAGRKRLAVALLGAAALSSGLNLIASSKTVSNVSVAAGLVVTVALAAVLVKHVLSRADPE
jgi:hypothetical protein